MKNVLGAAVLVALLTGGSITAGQAQMNSAGDGLDGRRAVREGNARPYRADSMGGRSMNRMRKHRMRHHRRHR